MLTANKNSMREYELQFSNTDTSSGDVGFKTLVGALNAFTSSAKYVAYLFATGQSATQNTSPNWLRDLIGFRFVFERSGHSSICFRAPTLNHAAPKQFSQRDVFESRAEYEMDDTSVDLVYLSIKELLSEQSKGDAYDENVLSSLLRFQHLRSSPDVELSVKSIAPNRGTYTLNFDQDLFESCSRRRDQIPRPSRHIISGKLDEIAHSRQQFKLEIAPHERVIGRLGPTFDDVESLRSLWGHQATVTGFVHYKVSGAPRFIEADQILPSQKGDETFRKIPNPVDWHGTDPPAKRGRNPKEFDFKKLIGSWPGDEPIEELMSELKDLG